MNPLKDHYFNNFKNARQIMYNVMHLITPVANNRPEGFPVSVAARIGNLVVIADTAVIGSLAGETPYYLGEWKDPRNGYSITHPGLDGDIDTWMKTVTFNVHEMHKYVVAVMDRIDAMMEAADDAAMSKKITVGPMGEMTVGQFIDKATEMLLTASGEISILRQINGLSDGYAGDTSAAAAAEAVPA